MSVKTLSTVTTELITSYGNSVRNLIQAYRASNQRVVNYFDQRWETALAQSASELRKDVRSNARTAQKAVTGMYIKGITIGSDRADTVVQRLMELAGRSVQQVAVNADRLEQRTGLKSLSGLAQVAVPAVGAVAELADKLALRTSAAANRIAGQASRTETGAAYSTTARKPAARRKAAGTRLSRKAA